MIIRLVRVLTHVKFTWKFCGFSLLLGVSACLDIIIISACAPIILNMLGGSDISFSQIGVEIPSFLSANFSTYIVSLLVLKITFQLLIFRWIYRETFKLYGSIVTIVVDKVFDGIGNGTASQLSSSITAELEDFVKSMILPAFLLISELAIITLIIIYLLYVDAMLMSTIICVALIFYTFFRKIISEKLSAIGVITRESRNELIEVAQFASLQKSDIISLGTIRFFTNKISEVMNRFANASSSYQFFITLPRLVIELLALLGLVLLASASDFFNIDAITLTIFGVSIIRLLPALQRVFISSAQIRYGSRTLLFLEDLLENKLVHNSHNLPVRFDDFHVDRLSQGYAIRYRREGKENTFRCCFGLNLVFGVSGIGKTCFLNSLQEFFLSDGGYYSAKMQQGAQLFNGTLYENIILNREFDIERLQRLLKIFFQDDHQRINSDTLQNIMVSDNGSGLSGGQVQRVCLLRTLIVKKEFYLIDEGFANLNPELRDTLFESLNAFLREDCSAAIVVTHSYKNINDYNYMEIK